MRPLQSPSRHHRFSAFDLSSGTAGIDDLNPSKEFIYVEPFSQETDATHDEHCYCSDRVAK